MDMPHKCFKDRPAYSLRVLRRKAIIYLKGIYFYNKDLWLVIQYCLFNMRFFKLHF